MGNVVVAIFVANTVATLFVRIVRSEKVVQYTWQPCLSVTLAELGSHARIRSRLEPNSPLLILPERSGWCMTPGRSDTRYCPPRVARGGTARPEPVAASGSVIGSPRLRRDT